VTVLSYPWLTTILALPWILVAASALPLGPVVLRRAAIGVAIAMLGLAVPPLVQVSAHEVLVDPLDPARAFGLAPLWRTDLLSAPLVPFAIGVWLFLLALAPRQARTPAMIRSSALGVATTLAMFLTRDEPLLAVLWAASSAVLLADVYDARDRRLFRILLVYLGAALALVQRDSRRAFGYLFVSQSAFVMTGIETSSVSGITSGLCLWLSSGAAFTGLALTVWVLEARRGRLDLSRFHGSYAHMPLIASSFLLLGLACSGFPGTLGFIGNELLLEAAVTSFPYAGFLVVLATALSGIAVMRMYFSLFCGRADVSMPTPFRRRKTFVFAALVGVMLVFGVAPKTLVDSRASAARDLLAERALAHDR
jgi:hypothetical protein